MPGFAALQRAPHLCRLVGLALLTPLLAGCRAESAVEIPAEPRATDPSLAHLSALDPSVLRAPVRELPYKHMETTGLTETVKAGDITHSILFRSDSDAGALTALRALRYEVYAANADGERLIVIGQLGSNTLRTPEGAGRPTPEDYRELRLLGWYLVAPFREYVLGETAAGLPGVVGARTRNTLMPGDFSDSTARSDEGLTRYLRQAR